MVKMRYLQQCLKRAVQSIYVDREKKYRFP